MVIQFQNRTAGLQTGRLVPELDKALDRDRTCTSSSICKSQVITSRMKLFSVKQVFFALPTYILEV